MKILSTVLALTLSLSSFAGVAEDVEALGNLAFGSTVTKSSGKTATAVFKNWLKESYDSTGPLVNKEIEDMEFGDEVEEGFTSVESAISMRGFAQATFENSSATKKIALLNKNWSPLIKKLSTQGVKFGYTGYGPGYCGVSFIELIIVDEKDQKVYQVYLSESGDC